MTLLRERLEVLILARLSAQQKSPLSIREVEESLRPFIQRSVEPQEFRSAFEQAIAELQETQHITQKPLQLTDLGRKKLAKALGTEDLPKALTWRSIKQTYLPALALGVAQKSKEVMKRVSDADGLRAMILRRHHNLPGKEAPTLGQVVDALIAKELGLDSAGKLTFNKVRAHLLRRLLDDGSGNANASSSSSSKLDFEKMKQVLAAKSLGTATRAPEHLRAALVNQWLLDEESNERATAHPATPRSSMDNQEVTAHQERPIDAGIDLPLSDFASAVSSIAREPETSRYSEDRAYIASVFDRFRENASDDWTHDMSLAAFKERLVEANREGLLRLARADLVEEMDPQLVARSETSYLNATFHFVETGTT